MDIMCNKNKSVFVITIIIFFTLSNIFKVLDLHANRTTNYQRIPFCSLEKHSLASFQGQKLLKVLILNRCQAIILVVPDDYASFVTVSPGKRKTT